MYLLLYLFMTCKKSQYDVLVNICCGVLGGWNFRHNLCKTLGSKYLQSRLTGRFFSLPKFLGLHIPSVITYLCHERKVSAQKLKTPKRKIKVNIRVLVLELLVMAVIEYMIFHKAFGSLASSNVFQRLNRIEVGLERIKTLYPNSFLNQASVDQSMSVIDNCEMSAGEISR